MKNLNIILTLIIVLLAQNQLWANNEDDNEYAVSKIPKKLLDNANAVVRKSEEVFTIQSVGKGKHKVKVVYTILNEKADRLSKKKLYYDQLRTISYLRGKLYDKDGNVIDKLKKTNISDEKLNSGYFMTDGRTKTARLSSHSYPYTVEFEYEIIYNGLNYLPSWWAYTVYGKDISVQSTTYEVSSPSDLEVKYKEFNLESFSAYEEQSSEAPTSSINTNVPKVKITNEGDIKKYSWILKNLTVFKSENYTPSWRNQLPRVKIALSKFEVEGYTGSMNSWKEYGMFYYNLNKGRDELPEETINKVKDLTKGLSSPIEKAKVIYEYLQSKTRYVYIGLGIGGNQPFPAKDVDEKGYGDCKALTNYTQAMLKEVGVKSYYTLVGSGRDATPVDKSFPTDYFDHIILCVPMEKDTVWLECTSQTQAFGYISDFTGDRDVLVVTPEGGKLAHTTVYTQEDNLLNRKGEVHVTPTGDAKATIQTDYGALQEGARWHYVNESKEVQKKWFYRIIDIPSFEIEDFSLERTKGRVPISKEVLKLNIRKCAFKTGKRLFIKPNLMNKMSYVPPQLEERTQEVYLPSEYDFKDIDVMTYHIPEGYEVEYLPKKVSFSSRFGEYQVEYKFENNKLVYLRTFKMNKGTYSAESYDELRDFYKKVVKADKVKVVFVKKGE